MKVEIDVSKAGIAAVRQMDALLRSGADDPDHPGNASLQRVTFEAQQEIFPPALSTILIALEKKKAARK